MPLRHLDGRLVALLLRTRVGHDRPAQDRPDYQGDEDDPGGSSHGGTVEFYEPRGKGWSNPMNSDGKARRTTTRRGPWVFGGGLDSDESSHSASRAPRRLPSAEPKRG
jgi:hypothetical protein